MRVHRFGITVALGLALMGSPAFAAPPSGGGSGGGAIEGGEGAPGGGVGIPGSIVNDTTAEGIGENATGGRPPALRAYKALVPAPLANAGQPWDGSIAQPHRHHGQRSAF